MVIHHNLSFDEVVDKVGDGVFMEEVVSEVEVVEVVEWWKK